MDFSNSNLSKQFMFRFECNAMLKKMFLLESPSNNVKILNFMEILSSHLRLNYQGDQAYMTTFYPLSFEQL